MVVQLCEPVVEEGWVSCSIMQVQSSKVDARQGLYLLVWSMLQYSSTACIVKIDLKMFK